MRICRWPCKSEGLLFECAVYSLSYSGANTDTIAYARLGRVVTVVGVAVQIIT